MNLFLCMLWDEPVDFSMFDQYVNKVKRRVTATFDAVLMVKVFP